MCRDFIIIDEKKRSRSKSPFGKIFSRKKEESVSEPASPEPGKLMMCNGDEVKQHA